MTMKRKISDLESSTISNKKPRNRCCQEKTCNKIPVFNYPDETKGIYCGVHKLKDMVNVVDKKCQEKDCNTQPTFNFPDEKIGKYCGDHKKETMVNVVSKKCLEKDCNTRPSFNFPDDHQLFHFSIHDLMQYQLLLKI